MYIRTAVYMYSKRKRVSLDGAAVMEPKEAVVECKASTHFTLSYDKGDGCTALAYGLMSSVSVNSVSLSSQSYSAV